MKKIFQIFIISIIWCNSAIADITLYCKQEVRILYRDGEVKKIPMKQDWKLVITKDEIKVPGYESLYYDLMRKNEDENEYNATTELKLIENAGGVAYFKMINIDRTTGEGFIHSTLMNKSEKEPFICTDKEIKKKNLF